MIQLIKYVRDIAKLGHKVYRRVDQHEGPAWFGHEIPDKKQVDTESDFLKGVSFTIRRPDIPSKPPIPKPLRGWLSFEEEGSHTRVGHIDRKEIDEDGQLRFEEFDQDEERIAAFLEFKSNFEQWSKAFEENKPVLELFDDLFQLKDQMKYDEDIELVWGYGLLVWYKQEQSIRYPLFTQQLTLEHKAKQNLIEVFPLQDAEISLSLDFLADLDLPDYSNIQAEFEQQLDEDENFDFANYLQEIAGQLSSSGTVLPFNSEAQLTPTDELKVLDEWVILARDRKRGAYTDDLNRFLHLFEDKEESVPDAVASFLEEPDDTPGSFQDFEPRTEWDAFKDRDLLFPRPANQEQVEVLDRIEKSDQVMVQGPPGTGKSHTIVNLISHHVAHGDRVLVTSKKSQALRVLHNMLPEDLQTLCISLLGNDPESRQKMETAVRQISEIVNSNSTEFSQKISRLQDSIEKNTQQLTTNRRKIESIENTQYHQIKPPFGDSPVLPGQLSKMFTEEASEHQWLSDQPDYTVQETKKFDKKEKENRTVVEIDPEYPLTDEEFTEFLSLRNNLEPYLYELPKQRPSSENLLSIEEFHELQQHIHQHSELEDEVGALLKELGGLTFQEPKVSTLEETLAVLKKYIGIEDKIDSQWKNQLKKQLVRTEDFKVKNKEEFRVRLKEFIADQKERLQNIKELREEQDLTIGIKKDDTFTLQEQLEAVQTALNRVKLQKSPWTWFKPRLWSKIKFLKSINTDSKQPQSVEDWEQVEISLELEELLEKLVQKWSNFKERVDVDFLPNIEKSDYITVTDFFETISAILTLANDLTEKAENLLQEIFVEDLSLLSVELSTLNRLIEQKLKLAKLVPALKKHRSLKKELLQLSNHEDSIDLVDKLIEALPESEPYDQGDEEQWIQARARLEEIEKYDQEYRAFLDFKERLSSQAPEWAKRWIDPTINENDLLPDNWKRTWWFKTAEAHLEDILEETERLEGLKTEQEKLERKLQSLKKDLVGEKTKLNIHKNITDRQLQSLQSYLVASRKLGKGTGKYAPKWRREIRKEISTAQHAVPAWIMPIYQVCEQLPAETKSFDLLIVDEASQSDLRALPALLRAEKVIVVGDDKQISPSFVGIRENQVDRILREHLAEFPKRQRWHLKTSLYDLAGIFFSRTGSLMLKEHFRCVPEIIEFSNSQFYNGQMIPLRNPPSSERLSPPLVSVFVEDGYREEERQINHPEALAICHKLQELVTDPRYEDKTFGVISLTGDDQAKHIMNLVSDYLTPEQLEDRNFYAGDAYAFQGDERDIMLLSMLISENDERQYRALVSPSSQQRFNVAASRAKDQLILFHSIRLEKLSRPDDMRRLLLDHVRNREQKDTARSRYQDKFESTFEEEVFDRLVNQGYRVIPQVEPLPHREFRIDLVVEGESDRLAVECDGDRYHAGERRWEDFLRQRQLERAGWEFWRIWSSQFNDDPEQTITDLTNKLKAMRIKPIGYDSEEVFDESRTETFNSQEVSEGRLQDSENTSDYRESEMDKRSSSMEVQQATIDDERTDQPTSQDEKDDEDKTQAPKLILQQYNHEQSLGAEVQLEIRNDSKQTSCTILLPESLIHELLEKYSDDLQTKGWDIDKTDVPNNQELITGLGASCLLEYLDGTFSFDLPQRLTLMDFEVNNLQIVSQEATSEIISEGLNLNSYYDGKFYH